MDSITDQETEMRLLAEAVQRAKVYFRKVQADCKDPRLVDQHAEYALSFLDEKLGITHERLAAIIMNGRHLRRS